MTLRLSAEGSWYWMMSLTQIFAQKTKDGQSDVHCCAKDDMASNETAVAESIKVLSASASD